MLVALQSLSCQPKNVESNPHVIALRELARDTPVYPGFEKTGESLTVKRRLVRYFVFYRSNKTFSEIEDFYHRELTARSWRSDEIYLNTYRKGDCVIVVEKDERSENNFDVVFKWVPR
jgi:hypothetical protein